MKIVMPDIVTQRDLHWRGPNSAPLPLRQEMADWVWEKWNAGQLDISLTPQLERDMVELKTQKDSVYPSDKDKIEEEMEEVINARDWSTKDASGRGLYKVMRDKHFDKSDWELAQFMLNMPSEPIEPYLQYAVLKLQGRVAANKTNPKATSEEIKHALHDYEDTAAKRTFDAMA